MKKILTLLITLVIMLSSVVPVYAADGKVNYIGKAKEFVFEPGSKYSLTDLFPEFKEVMPGDKLTQEITVKNDASNKVKVKIYIRSLGAHENSEKFLSKLDLTVKKSDNNESAYMFDAAANKTAQLTDWVCLGTLYSGGEVNLDVTLDVPKELDNKYQNEIGYLEWQFMIEEFPIEVSDPQPPKTGDDSNVELWTVFMCASLSMLFILLIWRKKYYRTLNKEE